MNDSKLLEDSRSTRFDYNLDFRLSETSPASNNGLLDPIFITYYIGWSHIVNPESKNFSIIYNGMGPDVCTALFSTNASEITSADPNHPNLDGLNYYLKYWDIIDTDLYNLPGKVTLMPDALQEDASEENLNEYLHLILLNVSKTAHWDSLDIRTLGISRCILIELKKLGVQRDTIKIIGDNDDVTIEFDWGFPGEKEKKRTLHFGANFLEDVFEDQREEENLFDAYFEKSIMAGSMGNVSQDILNLWDIIEPHGYILMGSNDVVKPHEYIGTDNRLSIIGVPDNYSSKILQRYPHLRNGYTWELNGFIRDEI